MTKAPRMRRPNDPEPIEAPGPARTLTPGFAVALAALLFAPLAAHEGPQGASLAGPAVVEAQQIERFDPDPAYQTAPEPIDEFLHRDPDIYRLDYPSPDGDRFIVPRTTHLSSLERMARTTYRLGEMELRPQVDRLWDLDRYGTYGILIYSMEERDYVEVDLPEDIFVSDMTWSPDGERVAFLAHLDERTEIWTADAATGAAAPAADAAVMATMAARSGGSTTFPGPGSRASDMIQWTPEGTLLTLLVPPDRGAEPEEPTVPPRPDMRRTLDERAPTRTRPNLLEDDHDADLFEHYTRSQLAEVDPGDGDVRLLGEPAMYRSISLSPDGDHVLATTVERPFSFYVRWTRFPHRTAVLAREDGERVATIRQRPLRETSGPSVPRSQMAWRPDGAGLAVVERPDDNNDAHRLMLLEAPFDTADARVVAESEQSPSGVRYTPGGEYALATVRRSGERALVRWALDEDPPRAADEPEADELPERTVVLDFQPTDDPTDRPGSLVTRRTSNGLQYALLNGAGDAVYVEGDGYREDFRPQPFVDRVSVDGGEPERVFEGARDHYDEPLVPLDGDLERMIVSRESPTDVPDSYLWTPGSGLEGMENLTRNEDPFPELTEARRENFEFVRRDGLTVQGRISLPTDYEEGDEVPAVFWTYPREYTQAEHYENAAIRSWNHNEFPEVTWLRWSDMWLSQGYALVHPDVPIVGENYNDQYISHLSNAMYAAIQAVDDLGYVDMRRIGHGGHSYGAFATANILAHSPYFRAGIAGAGAYNRSLTPAGFQAERRLLWEAPHTYLEISPFFAADQIDTPLLMYHGADDNNSGTWPMQSERLMHALRTLGKDAVLYMYAFESHTPRAMAHNQDMWARWIEWFDHYVKGEGEVVVEDESSGGR